MNPRRWLPSFGTNDSLQPVLWDEASAGAAAGELMRRYHECGYALFVTKSGDSESVITSVSRKLGLGETYIPAQYANYPNGSFLVSGFNKVEATAESSHRGFSSADAQELHSDGTLEPVGRVATSILFCVYPAAEGGETRIFDSVDAFERVVSVSPELRHSLLDANALSRRDVGRTEATVVGPVFSFTADGALHSRFSMDNTSEWEKGFAKVKDLRRAYDALLCLTRQPDFGTSVTLRSGWGIVLANSKVSHARTSFRNDPQSPPRLLLRGLFLRRAEREPRRL